MRWSEANRIVLELAGAMQPYCEKLSVAGSIRRMREEVKDLEICCVPRWENETPPQLDLFAAAAPVRVNRLYTEWGQKIDPEFRPEARQEGDPLLIRWLKGCKPEGKYWQGELDAYPGLKLDLFLTTPEQWGIILLIRTGHRDFSQAIAARALRIGMKIDGGFLHDRQGNRLVTPTEESVFRALGLDYVEPRERTGAEAVRVSRRAA